MKFLFELPDTPEPRDTGRDSQLMGLKANSPLRSTQAQHDESSLALFIAADEPQFLGGELA